MMPKPKEHKTSYEVNRNESYAFSSEKVVHQTKPSFWLYSDNFILKIVVLFILVLMFAPIMTLVYSFHSQLVKNFHIAIDNVMFYTELLIFLCILIVIIKLILDVLDWNYTSYVFTDARIIIERGFIHKEKIIMSYNKIQDIEIRQSILERIMSVGDIIVYGANEMSETILDDIPSPKKVEEIIITRVNNAYANQTPFQNNNYQQNYGNTYPNQQAYPQNDYVNQNIQENMQYTQNTNAYGENVQYNQTDDDVIIPDHQNDEREYNHVENIYNKQPNKDEVFKKHDEMFRRHKK